MNYGTLNNDISNGYDMDPDDVLYNMAQNYHNANSKNINQKKINQQDDDIHSNIDNDTEHDYTSYFSKNNDNENEEIIYKQKSHFNRPSNIMYPSYYDLWGNYKVNKPTKIITRKNCQDNHDHQNKYDQHVSIDQNNYDQHVSIDHIKKCRQCRNRIVRKIRKNKSNKSVKISLTDILLIILIIFLIIILCNIIFGRSCNNIY